MPPVVWWAHPKVSCGLVAVRLCEVWVEYMSTHCFTLLPPGCLILSHASNQTECVCAVVGTCVVSVSASVAAQPTLSLDPSTRQEGWGCWACSLCAPPVFCWPGAWLPQIWPGSEDLSANLHLKQETGQGRNPHCNGPPTRLITGNTATLRAAVPEWGNALLAHGGLCKGGLMGENGWPCFCALPCGVMHRL